MHTPTHNIPFSNSQSTTLKAGRIFVKFARKKVRQTGREVRKKRRELRDGVYPTNLPDQNVNKWLSLGSVGLLKPSWWEMNFSKHQCPEQEWRRLLEAAKRAVCRSFPCLVCVVLGWQIGRVNSIAQLPSLLSYFPSCLSFFLSCKLYEYPSGYLCYYRFFSIFSGETVTLRWK